MSYLDMITLSTPHGTAAFKPEDVTLVFNRGETKSELRLISGHHVELTIDAESAANALWGRLSKASNGYFNDDHVVAIIPHGTGSRLLIKHDVTLDFDAPSIETIKSLRVLQANRDNGKSRDRDA